MQTTRVTKLNLNRKRSRSSDRLLNTDALKMASGTDHAGTVATAYRHPLNPESAKNRRNMTLIMAAAALDVRSLINWAGPKVARRVLKAVMAGIASTR